MGRSESSEIPSIASDAGSTGYPSDEIFPVSANNLRNEIKFRTVFEESLGEIVDRCSRSKFRRVLEAMQLANVIAV